MSYRHRHQLWCTMQSLPNTFIVGFVSVSSHGEKQVSSTFKLGLGLFTNCNVYLRVCRRKKSHHLLLCGYVFVCIVYLLLFAVLTYLAGDIQSQYLRYFKFQRAKTQQQNIVIPLIEFKIREHGLNWTLLIVNLFGETHHISSLSMRITNVCICHLTFTVKTSSR